MNELNFNAPIFGFSMAGYTKGDKIAKVISRFFICKKFALDFMVNMQSFFSKFVFRFSANNAFIPIPHKGEFSLRIPIDTVIIGGAYRTIQMMILSSCIITPAFYRAKIFISSFCKSFTAIFTNLFGISFHAFILAAPRAIFPSPVFKSIRLSFKGISTNLTSHRYFRSSRGDLAFFTAIPYGSKLQKYFFNLKGVSAIFTIFSNGFHFLSKKVLPAGLRSCCSGKSILAIGERMKRKIRAMDLVA